MVISQIAQMSTDFFISLSSVKICVICEQRSMATHEFIFLRLLREAKLG
jgi:hypothetical protein